MTVVFDPADTTMKACVGSSWVTLASGGGATNLDDLSDVVIASPANNHVLLFNGTNWVNSAISITETDPKVGALTGNQWCAANAGGTAIVCNQAAPSAGSSSSGAAGYVQLSGGAGAFANSGTTAGEQLFWDNTNKRLGIGMTSPGMRLDVSGAIRTDDIVKVERTPSSGFWAEIDLISGRTGTNQRFWNIANDATSGRLRFRILDDTRTTELATGLTLDRSGNVGIGTTSPSERLEVAGNVKANQFCNAAGICVDPSSLVPTGAVMAFDLTACPSGWSEYTAARGRFLRGIDNGAGNDPAGTRAPGDIQADALGSHLHSVDPPNTATTTNGSHVHGLNDGSGGGVTGFGTSYVGNAAGFTVQAWMGWYHTYIAMAAAGDHSHTVDIGAFNSANTGSTETRPKNVAVLFCRKN
ncbi:MAG: hypothetical protein O9296_16260 [Novosphingobium sp.]|nr:hypothetical protein [Novosphingobium sp.]